MVEQTREEGDSKEPVKCEVCGIWCNSGKQYRDHCIGDRHRKTEWRLRGNLSTSAPVYAFTGIARGIKGRAAVQAALKAPDPDDSSGEEMRCCYQFTGPPPAGFEGCPSMRISWGDAVPSPEDLWKTWRGGPRPVGANKFIYHWGVPTDDIEGHWDQPTLGFNRRRPVALCVNDVLAVDASDRWANHSRLPRLNIAIREQRLRSSAFCELGRVMNLRDGYLDKYDDIDRVLAHLVARSKSPGAMSLDSFVEWRHPSTVFEDYVSGCLLQPINDFAVQGTRIAKWSLEKIREHGDGTLGRHWAFAQGTNLGNSHPDVLMHGALSRVIELAVSEDQLDVVNLASFEVILRILGVLELHHEKALSESQPVDSDAQASGSIIFGKAPCLISPELDSLWQKCRDQESGHTPRLTARISEQFIFA